MKKRTSWSLIVTLLSLIVACDQKMAQSNLSDAGRFGQSIATFDSTAIVGAPRENGERGAAYVFASSDGVLGPQARLQPRDPGAGNQFGDAVAAGNELAVVGAPRVSLRGVGRVGAVYAFSRSGSTWSQQAKLTPPSPEASQAFGQAVDLDGVTLVVGAPARDVGSIVDAGVAYVYEYSSSRWTLTATLTAPGGRANDHFGSRVVIADDRIYVGAADRDAGRLVNCGAVYVFAKHPAGWRHTQTLSASDAGINDSFGSGLAVTQVSDGRRLLVGATGNDLPGNSNAGAVYHFAETGVGVFSEIEKLVASTPAPNAHFGGAIAALETRAVVGAAGEHEQRGAGYVFDYTSGTFSETIALVVDDVEVGDLVGTSVGVSALGVTLGATGTDVDAALSDAGAVHLFSDSSSWNETLRLAATERTERDGFAQDVAVSGDWADVASNSGVDVLRRDAAYWSLTQQLPTPAGYVARVVAMDGDRLAVFSQSNYLSPPFGELRVYTFDGLGSWTLDQILAPDLDSLSFPHDSANSPSLSLFGDRLVLGAPRWNGGDGRVFVYTLVAGTWTEIQVFTSASAAGAIDQNYGRWVRLNATTLAVSEVPNIDEPTAVPKHGRVHIYDWDGDSFEPTVTLTAPTPADVDWFGRGLALAPSGRLAIVGEDLTLRVYSRVGNTYISDWELPISGISTYPDLDFDDNHLALGASDASYNSLTAAGEVRVYLQSGSGWSLERTERAGDAVDSLGLGTRVAFDGGSLLAGAHTSVGFLYAF